MQAAIANAAPPPRAARRKPGWRGWMLMLPMLLWLAAFVIFPSVILFVYSLCKRGFGTPVEYSLTGANYLRVIGGTNVGPLVRHIAIAIGIGLAAAAIQWFCAP